jgi:hypothetical protein
VKGLDGKNKRKQAFFYFIKKERIEVLARVWLYISFGLQGKQNVNRVLVGGFPREVGSEKTVYSLSSKSYFYYY